MEVMEALLQRQSVKSAPPTPVEPEKLAQVSESRTAGAVRVQPPVPPLHCGG
ncbi:MAG: hypothetical protein V8R55_06905 [Dysosmobacter sp.]